jgi:hypothetical protein
MPGETSSAASVTDEKLLAMAKAGANWKCAYCGSDQRAVGGECARCGAGRKDRAPAAAAVPRAPGSFRKPWLWAVLGLALALVGGFVRFMVWAVQQPDPIRMVPAARRTDPTPEIEVTAVVTGLRWEHVVITEELRPVPHDGFEEQKPGDAFDVVAQGPRQHHTERVQDGFETEHYQERVQDGVDRTPYTERVACGQECTDRPQTCRETCTPNKNGFATCRTTCTGGGQSCTTKYCSETRYKETPRYKMVDRTRQVPHMIDRPVMRTWFAWKTNEWIEVARTDAKGTALPTTWPAPSAVPAPALAKLPGDAGAGTFELAPKLRVRRTTVATAILGPSSKAPPSLRVVVGSVETTVPEVELAAAWAPGTEHRAMARGGRLERIAGSAPSIAR